jgi:hypothetical protein
MSQKKQTGEKTQPGAAVPHEPSGAAGAQSTANVAETGAQARVPVPQKSETEWSGQGTGGPMVSQTNGGPPSPEKLIEKQLMDGDDMAFDSRMNAPASVPTVASKDAQGVDPKAFARELAAEMAAVMPKPAPQTDMVAQAEMIGMIVDKIIRGLREPSEEQKEADRRRKANRAIAIKEQAEMLEAQQAFRDNCPHETSTSDGKSHSNITAIHNFADGVVRGVCNICQGMIEPGNKEFYRIVIAQHNLAVRSMHS